MLQEGPCLASRRSRRQLLELLYAALAACICAQVLRMTHPRSLESHKYAHVQVLRQSVDRESVEPQDFLAAAWHGARDSHALWGHDR